MKRKEAPLKWFYYAIIIQCGGVDAARSLKRGSCGVGHAALSRVSSYFVLLSPRPFRER